MALSRSSKTKALWSGAITVAVLAIVIIVAAALAPSGSKKAPTAAPSPAAQSADQSRSLYQQAVQAQQSGDLTRTVELARSAIQADPSNTQAKTLLDAVSASKPGATSSTPSTGSDNSSQPVRPPSDALFMKVFKPMSLLAPKAFTGFDLDTATVVRRDLTMSGSPVDAGALVSNVIWAIHDAKTRAAAKGYVVKTSKKAYPKDAAIVVVDGVPGYFGTDGTEFATVSFSRGRYAFEVLASAVPGVEPLQLKAVALDAARAYPDKP